MANIFVISDTHFGHTGILSFKNKEGQALREFDDVDHMDAYMIDCWNSVVKPQDKVYHLGDVLFKRKDWSILRQLQGHKRLILGNHDNPKMKLYLPYFEAIYSSRLLDKMLFTHIPVHPYSLGKAIANVHGHVHNNVSETHFGKQYINISVEVIRYTPMAWEDLKQLVAKRLGDIT